MMTSSNMDSTIESRTQGGWNSLSSGLKFSSDLQDDSCSRGDSGLEFISLNELLIIFSYAYKTSNPSQYCHIHVG